MRVSQVLLPTLREPPADAEIISHQLMLRAGMVRRIASGIYTWLPLGLRVLRKAETVVRQEMEQAGAQEVMLPGVQPSELWEESTRWDAYGPELLRFTDRHGREFCLGPTHEEIITDLARREIRSYRQLPANFFQIQTKFRDEVRPRFGIMRAREFLMKDAYSFHIDEPSLQQTYQDMFDAYTRIFSRLGFRFRAVSADSGSIGGDSSHEFHALADSGEDQIAFSTTGSYAANVELAPTLKPSGDRPLPSQAITQVATPDQQTIEQVSKFLGVTPAQCAKTLLVEGERDELVALILRGDHELNPLKAEKLDVVKAPLTLAHANTIAAKLGVGLGSIGPKDLDFPVIADFAAGQLSDFVCGANADGFHLTNVNWGRDVAEPETADLRNVVAGDPSPDGDGTIEIARGIEVGHIFQLGTKYSAAMKATCLDEKGKAQTLVMGCYGIGVSRIVAAAIEQHHDDRGIIWPHALAPFQVALAPINLHKSVRLREAIEQLYEQLQQAGIETLLDDRKERPGVIFADLELIGIPHRLVLSDRNLDAETVEYKNRATGEELHIAVGDVIPFIQQRIADSA